MVYVLEDLDKNATHLEFIKMNECSIGSITKDYHNSVLERLVLSNPELEAEDFIHLIQGLTHLKQLEIKKLNLNLLVSQKMDCLPQLERLSLGKVSSSLVEFLLVNKPFLKSLFLDSCELPDQFSSELLLPKLEDLKLQFCTTLTLDHLKHLLSTSTKLKHLTVLSCVLSDLK